MRRGLMRWVGAAALGAGFGAPALAEDGSRDRAEFDAAAGRALFQPISTAEAYPSRPTAAAGRSEPNPTGDRPQRRAVRVILPSPYGR